jgi:hypothetical protein
MPLQRWRAYTQRVAQARLGRWNAVLCLWVHLQQTVVADKSVGINLIIT